MRRTRRSLTVFAAAFAVAASLLAGCGSSDQTSTADANGVTKLRVGYIPVGIYAYLWQARDAGYFEEQKLDVELVPMAGGGEIIPALQANSLQFGISDALGVLNARKNNIPVKYVTFNFSQSSDAPVHAVMTADPAVKSAKDLKGKTIATNLSFNTDWTMMREWLRKNGVDPEDVNFQEMPFPDMLAALRNKTISAAGVTEPFYTNGEKDGMTVLGHYFTDVKSPVALSGVTALDPYIEKNPEIVERFVAAIDKAVEDFKRDPNTARQAIAKNTKIPAEVVEEMNLGQWDTSTPVEDMQFWIDAARKEGILETDVDPADLLWKKN
jgi:ABC-type nitrate/sulfonate/bicarbonate transport system substrate-binding protein